MPPARINFIHRLRESDRRVVGLYSSGDIRGSFLVVDDFSPFREALCSFLLGYDPLTVIGEAADGDEGIMDVKMPRTNGIEATQRIKQTLPDIHVIGVSTQNDTYLKASMTPAGSSTFVTKDCAHTLPDVIATITGRPLTH